jgi:hypothetical protein
MRSRTEARKDIRDPDIVSDADGAGILHCPAATQKGLSKEIERLFIFHNSL